MDQVLRAVSFGLRCLRCLLGPCRACAPDPKGTSRFCAFYSFTGILFTGWVGLMISQQAFYIRGIDDPETFKDSAFGAMYFFIVTFAASLLYLFYDACYGYRFETHSYDRVPMPGDGLPAGMTDYEVNMELARSSGSGSAHSYSSSPSPLETDVNDSINYPSTVSERMRRRARKTPSFTTLGGELT